MYGGPCPSFRLPYLLLLLKIVVRCKYALLLSNKLKYGRMLQHCVIDGHLYRFIMTPRDTFVYYNLTQIGH